MARKDRMTKEREQRRKERRSGGRLVLGVGKRVSVLVLGVGCRVRKERLVDLGRKRREKAGMRWMSKTVISEKFAGWLGQTCQAAHSQTRTSVTSLLDCSTTAPPIQKAFEKHSLTHSLTTHSPPSPSPHPALPNRVADF
jgi:hypothetical protein